MVLCSIFGCGFQPWNLTLTSNYSFRLGVWSLLSSVSFLLLDSRSLFVIKRSVKIGKRENFFLHRK